MRSRLSLYDAVAHRAADLVVREYSTSFGLATRILPAGQRGRIRDVYALVRLADEVVDGATDEVGGDVEDHEPEAGLYVPRKLAGNLVEAADEIGAVGLVGVLVAVVERCGRIVLGLVARRARRRGKRERSCRR